MLSAFSDEASVHDEGQDMIGRAAIRESMSRTTRKYRVTVTPTGVGRADERTIVTARVSGTFPGSPVELRYHFTIVSGKYAAWRSIGKATRFAAFCRDSENNLLGGRASSQMIWRGGGCW